MTTDRADTPNRPYPGAAWSDLTYRGFPAPGETVVAPPERSAASRALPRLAIVGGGLVAALAVGLLSGLWARPDLGHPQRAQPMQAVTPPVEDAPQGQTLAIEVGKPAPQPAAQPRPTGNLEVLAPEMARAASTAVVPAAPPTPRYAVADPASAPQSAAPPVTPSLSPAPAQQRFAAAAGPCANIAGRAAQMVCADPELAAADRAMVRAYRRAIRSGASPEGLSRDQRAWFAAREEAARSSPRALADLYDQRIDELNAAADDDDGPSA